ncbi:MAG: hypothetical protein GC179_31160 [Anaerolineaceae bacterium]|nr:hypothetical protein [Anaerolineaceae bacterium]
MLKSPYLPRVLLVLGVAAVLVVAVGIYFVFDNVNRYNQLAAIDLQPLIATMKENQVNANMVADVEIRKHQLEVRRSEALAVIGVGAVALGLVSLVYTRLPDKPEVRAS